MYSNLKSVQYLIAGLKANGISDVVVSPGNSHNAIVRSLDEDSFFKTYNIVDERSAAFFACGLIQELKKPVAICCTSGTATTNYMTGVTEAFRRELPLVVITGDKNQYYLAQYEDQMIDSVSIFKSITRYGCVLPIIEKAKDEWYCQRVLNEAFLELNHHGVGPVHIDVPIEDGMLAVDGSFTTDSLPEFHKISRYELSDKNLDLSELFQSIQGKKIFIMCGQDDHIEEKEIELIEQISEKYNCIFATDKLSNLHCKGTLEVAKATKRMTSFMDMLCPDVVISIAGNPIMDYKFQLKNENKKIDHWIVNKEGRVADPFKKLSTVFEGTTIQFLEKMAQYGDNSSSHDYFEIWK
ncbi:MAG: thiamine pyrophosphate-binding protein, partial [Ruminococcus sp.]|nr:thiamine pyrophosphate-binding protein [Ruminococcus sp.]